MIQDIIIENFGFIQYEKLNIAKGFCVITGDTGAGKSMLLNAVRFLFGEPLAQEMRAAKPTRVCCRISDAFYPTLIKKLDNKLSSRLVDPKDKPLILERIYNNSRTQNCLQGIAISKAQLAVIADSVVHIHQQHQHLSFTNASTQRMYLDSFAQHDAQLTDTAKAYTHWQKLVSEQTQLTQQLAHLENPDHYKSVIDEYYQLGLDSIDLERLHQQQKQLQSRQAFTQDTQQVLAMLDGEHDTAILSTIFKAIQNLSQYDSIYPELDSVLASLNESSTLLTDAHGQLRSLADNDYTDDAQEYINVEQQLSDYHQFARKNQQQPEQLAEYIQSTEKNILNYNHLTEKIAQLDNTITQAHKEFLEYAKILHKYRATAAKDLSLSITQKLPDLGLVQAQFVAACDFDPEDPHIYGCDNVVFKFSANDGLIPTALDRCASGGELSRLVLLLELVLPQDPPKLMVFDEADVGVSGATASLIGSFLRQNSTHRPIICITHSPQVAAKAKYHWYVNKQQTASGWQSKVNLLNNESHIRAVAALLGGIDITDATMANAKQLCNSE